MTYSLITDKKVMSIIKVFLRIKIMKNSVLRLALPENSILYTSGTIALYCRKAKTHIETLISRKTFLHSFISFIFCPLFYTFCRKENIEND